MRQFSFSRERGASGTLMPPGPRAPPAPVPSNPQTCSTSPHSSPSAFPTSALLLLLLLPATSSFPSLSMVSLCPPLAENPLTGNMIKVICKLDIIQNIVNFSCGAKLVKWINDRLQLLHIVCHAEQFSCTWQAKFVT